MSRAENRYTPNNTANPSLAGRIRSYWSALDQGDDYAAQLRKLSGLPVLTAEDAIATLDWLIHDGHDPLADCYGSPDNPWPSIHVEDEGEAISLLREVITTSLIRELFNYIASTATGREP